MKKFIFIFLLMLISFSTNVSASNSNVVQKEVKSNIPEGYEVIRVYSDEEKSKISNFSVSQDSYLNLEVTPTIVDNVNNENVEVKTLKNEMRPLYDLKKISTGEIATEYIAEVQASATKNTSTWSGNQAEKSGVTAYATLYLLHSNDEYFGSRVALEKVDWRYETITPSKVVSRTHVIKQEGGGPSGAIFHSKTFNPTTNSGTNLPREWGWTPVASVGTYYKLGIDMTANVGKTWGLNLQCFYAVSP